MFWGNLLQQPWQYNAETLWWCHYTTLGNGIFVLSPRAVVPNLSGTSDWLLARLLLTSCCVAQVLAGQGPLLVRGLGVGYPCPRTLMYLTLNFGDSFPQTGRHVVFHASMPFRKEGWIPQRNACATGLTLILFYKCPDIPDWYVESAEWGIDHVPSHLYLNLLLPFTHRPRWASGPTCQIWHHAVSF